MDIETVEGQITVEPDPGEISYFYDDFNFSLFADFDLERNTTYRVTVPASAADPYGNTLGQDYTFEFNTPGFDPLISMNLPQQVNQLSRSHTSNIDIIYRNVSRIDAELYEVGVQPNTLLSPYLYDFIPEGPPIRTWTIEVEQQETVAEVHSLPLADGGVLPNGVYFLRTTGPQIIAEQRYWQVQNVLLIVADTNLVVKEMFNHVYVWATDLSSGQPVSGRNLALYGQQGEFLGEAVTDSGGLATFDYQPPEDYLQGVLVVSNEPGQAGFGIAGSNWSQKVTPWEFGLNTAWNDEPARFAYLHTDRPIYRPGDTVYFRGIVRDTDYG
jgi:uncharacterized protein YfaS (alpha-2-macroglobulin family)